MQDTILSFIHFSQIFAQSGGTRISYLVDFERCFDVDSNVTSSANDFGSYWSLVQSFNDVFVLKTFHFFSHKE